jgi:hypothetical protein
MTQFTLTCSSAKASTQVTVVPTYEER